MTETTSLTWSERKEFYVERNVSARGYDLVLITRNHNGATAAMRDIVMETIDEAAPPPVSPLTIRYEEAQNLIDELWRAGLRPTDGAGTAGAMARAEAHIKDLRAIAYKLLEINQ